MRGKGRAGPLVSAELSPGTKGVPISPQASPILPPPCVTAGAILRLPAAFQVRREDGCFFNPKCETLAPGPLLSSDPH